MSNAAAIKVWIFKNSRQARPAGREIQFPCPICNHKAHYFNPYKGVGFCHAASCQRVSTVSSLEDLWGEVGEFSVGAQEPEEAPVKVQLPKGCKPLIQMVNGQLVTLHPEAVQALKARNVSGFDTYFFGIQLDDEEDRVVIPVVDNGELVNYVSRSVWWYMGKTDAKRYMYAKGANTGDYLFNFAAVSRKSHLAIVENTFNAIWLKNHFPCTSSFGSHLSNAQIAQLAGRVKSVTIMWDRGAEDRAKAACKKLGQNGVSAKFVAFAEDGKQPDNYPAETLIEVYQRAAQEMNSPYWESGVPIGTSRN